jgi:hypothetical protein
MKFHRTIATQNPMFLITNPRRQQHITNGRYGLYILKINDLTIDKMYDMKCCSLTTFAFVVINNLNKMSTKDKQKKTVLYL